MFCLLLTLTQNYHAHTLFWIFQNMLIINTVIRGAHDNVRTCVISQFQSEVEKFIFPHTFCLLSILSYKARMIMCARALYSSFKVYSLLCLIDNHKHFCWLSVILTYSTSELTFSIHILLNFTNPGREKELISSDVHLFIISCYSYTLVALFLHPY